MALICEDVTVTGFGDHVRKVYIIIQSGGKCNSNKSSTHLIKII